MEFTTPNERLVLFDVKTVFPSTPTNETFLYLEDWLLRKKFRSIMGKQEVGMLMKLAGICVSNKNLNLTGKFDKRTSGVAKGDPLRMNSKGILPKIWTRYVDDIFTVLHRGSKQHQTG